MLRTRLIEDLEKEVLEGNPDAVNRELSYLVENEVDDLFMAQMETLEVEIHVN